MVLELGRVVDDNETGGETGGGVGDGVGYMS